MKWIWNLTLLCVTDRIFVDDNNDENNDIIDNNEKDEKMKKENKIEFEKIYEEMVKMTRHLDNQTDIFVNFESPNVPLKDISNIHKKCNSTNLLHRKIIKRETRILNE